MNVKIAQLAIKGGKIYQIARGEVLYMKAFVSNVTLGAMGAGPLMVPETSIPSIYVGESSRSIFERAGEHWRVYKKRSPDSHIWKHHLIHHRGEGEP